MDPAFQSEFQALYKEMTELKTKQDALYRRAAAMDVPDVELQTTAGEPVKLSALFGDHDDLILIHNMGQHCVYCTLWADGLRGYANHLQSRAALALATPDDPATAKRFAESRDWNFPVVSYAGSGLAKTLGFKPEPGQYYPGFSALHKNDAGAITRTGMAHFGPGDDFCPPYRFFEQLKGGVNGWEPRFTYD